MGHTVSYFCYYSFRIQEHQGHKCVSVTGEHGSVLSLIKSNQVLTLTCCREESSRSCQVAWVMNSTKQAWTWRSAQEVRLEAKV